MPAFNLSFVVQQQTNNNNNNNNNNNKLLGRGRIADGTPPALTPWGKQGLLSLPETYDTTTRPVFDKFFDTFGTSWATSAVFGGNEEDVLAWYSCIWKGT